MNEVTCLELPFTPTEEDILAEKDFSTSCPSITERISSLISQGREKARPLILFRRIAVEKDAEGNISIEAVPLEGDLAKTNLADSTEAFLFIASCGFELQQWYDSLEDRLDHSVAGLISDRALEVALTEFVSTTRSHLSAKNLSIMTPGSVSGWPISELDKIFHFLGDAAEEKGISLGSEYRMSPSRTVSGILFGGEKKFISCDHCNMKNCSLKESGFYEKITSPDQ